ncbi:MAG: DUF1501 domain-containing protein [Rhodobacteraceae bacterium]|nr:DUF1501 domain-containing protein [Paracoccaceae bacterium]
MSPVISRRSFLGRSAIVGCSLAASPLITPVSFASAPWDTRLVVIILRGAMDGLDVVQPYGRPGLAGNRHTLRMGPENGAHDLDGFFALHPGLGVLMPLWSAGELAFVHATSTPYRDKRSHFDGQDILESGTDSALGIRDGWLNRMLAEVPGMNREMAYAIGSEDMLLMAGDTQVSEWAPDAGYEISPQAELLMRTLMEQDPAMAAAYADASRLNAAGMEMGAMEGGKKRASASVKIAEFAADRLRGESRIAAFSIGGWDMHAGQDRLMMRTLKRLGTVITTMKERMGPEVWGKTVIVTMTEFGRTVKENGTRGTDHGTAGAMILVGGAVSGGRVYGDWPGLTEADLYKRRDLMPTTDVRSHAAWIIQGLIGLDRNVLETVVFPGLQMTDNPGLVL